MGKQESTETIASCDVPSCMCMRQRRWAAACRRGRGCAQGASSCAISLLKACAGIGGVHDRDRRGSKAEFRRRRGESDRPQRQRVVLTGGAPGLPASCCKAKGTATSGSWQEGLKCTQAGHRQTAFLPPPAGAVRRCLWRCQRAQPHAPPSCCLAIGLCCEHSKLLLQARSGRSATASPVRQAGRQAQGGRTGWLAGLVLRKCWLPTACPKAVAGARPWLAFPIPCRSPLGWPPPFPASRQPSHRVERTDKHDSPSPAPACTSFDRPLFRPLSCPAPPAEPTSCRHRQTL